MDIYTDSLPYEQGIADALQCLQAYLNGEGLRTEDEIQALGAWTLKPDPRYRNMDYAQGVTDVLLWLSGKTGKNPADADF